MSSDVQKDANTEDCLNEEGRSGHDGSANTTDAEDEHHNQQEKEHATQEPGDMTEKETDQDTMDPNKTEQTNSRNSPENHTEMDGQVNKDLANVHTNLATIGNKEIALTERMQRLQELLAKEREELGAVPLKDYARLECLKTVTRSSEILYRELESQMMVWNSDLSKMRQELTSISKLVDKKLTNEGLPSWIDQLQTDPSDPESVAREKQAVAKAAEANAAMAEASKNLPRFEERAAKLEADAALAAAAAQAAIEEANAARKRAEYAREAAERKRQAEDEASRKAEEERKRKQGEEKKRREEEERRKRELEKSYGTPEEQERRRLEEERRNPKNWPKWAFSVDSSAAGIPLGCVIRALPDTLTREDLTVECVPQLSGVLPLTDNEDIVSNIIKVTYVDESFKASEPLAIALPHCAPRNPAKDTVLKMLMDNGSWTELTTSDVTFEDIKDYKFVECRVERVATLAVITRVKNEKHTVHKRGGKVTSAVDGRVCFVVKQNMFKVSTTINLEVQPVDTTTIHDLHNRKPDCAGLIAASPMVTFNTPLRRYTKRVMVNVPLPSPNNKARQRPKTAVIDRSQTQENVKPRPSSAFGKAYQSKDDDVEQEQVHFLTQGESGYWTIYNEMSLTQPKNKDIVVFELDKPIDRFIILRCKEDVGCGRAERIANALEQTLYDRHVQFILRQRNDDASQVALVGANATKMESAMRRLSEKQFDYGPPQTEDVVMREGQDITVRFRGNISNENGTQEMKMVFNSNIKTKLNFKAVVRDTFAQKSIDCYRGFVQIFTSGLVPDKTHEEAAKEGKPVQMVTGEVLVGELLVNLPKPEPESPKPIVRRVPVKVRSEGFVDDDLLQFVASELGDEWRRVAQHLNVKRMRIQAIMRNNINNDTEKTIHDMLLTWIKRVPKSAHKVDILVNALIASGRIDLAEIVRDRERDYKREQSLSARDSYLRKGFVRVCQAPHVVSDWKFLARNLEVAEDKLDEIEKSFTSLRERCYQMLVMWREAKTSNATPAMLIKTLRKCRYNTVADQTEDVMKGAK